MKSATVYFCNLGGRAKCCYQVFKAATTTLCDLPKKAQRGETDQSIPTCKYRIVKRIKVNLEDI